MQEEIEGVFDGQLMNSYDGRKFPVPSNYASKSKLIEGDVLKLTILSDGQLMYKQIGKVPRKYAIGKVFKGEDGFWYVLANMNYYRVLFSSITYFRLDTGDTVSVTISTQIDASWANIESLISKYNG